MINDLRLATVALCSLLMWTASAFGGKATFSGEAPAETLIKMHADPKCVALYDSPVTTTRYVVGEDGGLANVFVFVKEAPAGDYPAPEMPVILEQKGCLYSPYVNGIQVNQTLRIENNDDHLHNVRALARANRPFNLAQPGIGVREKTFKLPEAALKFKCDVHPWMASFLFVLEHPFFAVSAADGSFEITGLPPGEYTLIAWHEKLGEQERVVTVGADGNATADFAFSAE